MTISISTGTLPHKLWHALGKAVSYVRQVISLESSWTQRCSRFLPVSCCTANEAAGIADTTWAFSGKRPCRIPKRRNRTAGSHAEATDGEETT